MNPKSEAPPVAEDPVAAKAKADTEAAVAQAKEARATLKLIKVVSTRRSRIDSPNAAWSLVEGANHFEGEIPEAVALVYAKLAKDGLATIDWIDGNGKAHPWTAPKLPNDDGKQH